MIPVPVTMRMSNKIPYCYGPPLNPALPTAGFGDYFKSSFVPVDIQDLAQATGFVAFVPLISTYYLLPGFKTPISPSGSHILDLIPELFVKAAAERRCVLVLDASFEGDPMMTDAYDVLHAWLEKSRIRRSDVIILNQNRALARQYNAAFGPGVRFGVLDAYVKKMLTVLAEPAAAFETSVGFSPDRLTVQADTPNRKTFLCMNGAPRDCRVVAAASMARAGILDDAEWSMLGGLAQKLEANLDAARTFRSRHEIDWVTDDDIASIINQMPKVIEIEKSSIGNISNSNQLALQINPDLFNSAFCSIVTETEFTDGEVQRVTEKLIKPLAIGHPVVLFGNSHSLAFARMLGFQTLSDFVDEGYDGMDTIRDRLAGVMRCLVEVRDRRRSGDAGFLEGVRARCAHNLNWARSGAALARYEEMVERAVVDLLAEAAGSLA
jgi:hypothetical protein